MYNNTPRAKKEQFTLYICLQTCTDWQLLCSNMKVVYLVETSRDLKKSKQANSQPILNVV